MEKSRSFALWVACRRAQPALLRGSVVFFLALIAVLGSLVGCGPGDGTKDRWNVLLVTFDTTRADRIGCYGNERIRTPTLDGLAADGVRFARALSAVPITAPSHSTILTGRYPVAHGVRDNGLFVLGEDELTLAEILRREGYATAAAVGAFPVTARFGFEQGFDEFDDHLTGAFENHLGERTVPKERLFFDERRAAQVNEALLPWLSEQAGDESPFFAWVHYFDPHQPFEPAPPYDQLYADDLYDGEIAYADSRLGFLLDHLESLGELDRTLVVMTADHGEGLGEHGELTHAVLAYNSTLHVPLIVRPPAGLSEEAKVTPGTVVDDWVGTIDIVPTILELLDVRRPDDLQGRSLVPLWQSESATSPRRRYAENLSPRLGHGWGELRVLFDGPMKYIHGPRPELYDLEQDPGELHDLIGERPEEAERMRRVLEGFIGRHAVAGASKVETLDEETRKRLESLGYLHGGSSGGQTLVETLTREGTPPQDRVGDISDVSAAKQLLFDERYAAAVHYTQELNAASPGDPLYLELHATALAGLGRLVEAWDALDELRRTGTVEDHLIYRLASATFERGDREHAVEALRAHLDGAPEAPGWWLLAGFHQRLAQPEAARRALEEALVLNPSFAPARVDLGVRLAHLGELDAAERELRRALDDAPYYAKGFYNYGTLSLHVERYDEAIRHFRRAIDLAPRYLEAHLALVATHLDAGERERAMAVQRELERLAPRSEQARIARELLAESRSDILP